MNNEQQFVKSKQRVADHGEVFTQPREVNAMLDLVKEETERIESRFLEPACGTGNFLVEILRRKLAVVERKYKNNQFDAERYSFLAVSSMYGIDILMDNVIECRNRLLEQYTDWYKALYKKTYKEEQLIAIEYLLHRNILWGDALTLETPEVTPKPIIFSEWSLVNSTQVQRRDFTLDMLLRSQPMEGDNLFSDLGEEAFIPTPIRSYPLCHYLEVANATDR